MKLTNSQYQILCEAKDGIITFDQARGNGRYQNMHRLVAKGFLEHFPSTTGKPFDFYWKLTPLALEIVNVRPS